MKKRIEPTLVEKAIEAVPGFDVYLCPFCKKGHMHTFEELPKISSPTTFYAIICNTN
jgi:hypothetical protein